MGLGLYTVRLLIFLFTYLRPNLDLETIELFSGYLTVYRAHSFGPSNEKLFWWPWIICLNVHTSSISRIDRSAVLDTSWWWYSFGLGGRWLQCHHHAVHDLNCHLGENEQAEKQVGIQADKRWSRTRKRSCKKDANSKTHSSTLKFSRQALSKWNFTEQVSESQFKENCT